VATGDALQKVAGVDVAYDRAGRRCVAAAVVLLSPTLTPLCEACWEGPVEAPYRPGLLATREAGPISRALARLSSLPDLILVDGHGRAHPRRWGLACAVGAKVRVPTVGVAKDPLVGRWDEPRPERGRWTPLEDRGEVVGAAVRTRARVKPVFVSVGWGVGLSEAVRWVLRLSPRYRLPEPIRAAHFRAGQILRSSGRGMGH